MLNSNHNVLNISSSGLVLTSSYNTS